MPRVLIIGEKPDLVDFSDPAIPPGTNEIIVKKGLDKALVDLRRKGIDADLALTTTSEAAGEEVAAALQGKGYDVIVVGAGLRVVPKMTSTFEAVMNAVHEFAPGSRLAFNLSPDDSAVAAERQLSRVD